MNWNFLKFKKEKETVIVKETQRISKIAIPSGTYKLPETLEFSMGATEETMFAKIMECICERYLEKEE